MATVLDLETEALSAGQALIDAQSTEAKLCDLYYSRRTVELLEAWKDSRQNVNKLAREYTRAIARLREASESTFGFAAERPISKASNSLSGEAHRLSNVISGLIRRAWTGSDRASHQSTGF